MVLYIKEDKRAARIWIDQKNAGQPDLLANWRKSLPVFKFPLSKENEKNETDAI